MDMQKEREAFSNWFGSSFTNGKVEFDNDGVPLGYEKAIAWWAWKAAKASAVPDGYVVVPKEPTKQQIEFVVDQMRLSGGLEMVEQIYKSMIEAAQEQP